MGHDPLERRDLLKLAGAICLVGSGKQGGAIAAAATQQAPATVALPPVQARAATTANVNLSNALTRIDDVTLNGNGAVGSDLVLVKDQTVASQNGLYWANTSAAMARTGEPLVSSRSILVSEGTTNAHSHWSLETKGPIQTGTTGIAFVRVLPWANVQAFGAVGDGSADDTSAISAAIAATAVTPHRTLSVVYFPPGIYKVTSPLLLSYAAGIYGIVLLGANRAADLIAGVSGQSIIRAAFTSLSGATASITSLSGTQVTIAGLSNLASAARGDTIQLTGAASFTNNNEFTILSVNAKTNSIIISNPIAHILPCVAPDAHNGHIAWSIRKPLIKCYSRSISFENLALDGANTISKCIDWTKDTIANAVTNLQITACSLTNAWYGLAVGDLGPNPSYPLGNVELAKIRDSYFNHGTGATSDHASIWIANTNGQSKGHSIIACFMLGAKFGLEANTGSFNILHSGFGNNAVSCVGAYGGEDTISLRDIQCENCARLFITNPPGGTNGGQGWLVSLDGIRFDTERAQLAEDGQVIKFHFAHGLHVKNSEFSVGVGNLETLSIGLGFSSTYPGIAATIDNCAFATSPANPIITSLAGSPGAMYQIIGACYSFDGNKYQVRAPGFYVVGTGVSLARLCILPFSLPNLALPTNQLSLSSGTHNDIEYQGWTSLDLLGYTGTVVITGFAGPSGNAPIDGQVLELTSSVAQSVVFVHQRFSQTAHQIQCEGGADVTMPPPPRGGFWKAYLKYFGASTGINKWRLLYHT